MNPLDEAIREQIAREARKAALDEAFQRMGAIVAERVPGAPKITIEGQHYGIASCREVLCEMLAPLVKS